MSRRTRAVLGIVCTAALSAVAACTTDHSDAKQPTQPARSSASGPATATAAPSSTQPSVQKPPELDNGEALAGRQKATTGNASIAYGKGRKGDALIVAVRCQGKGKLKVAMQSVHVSFPLECVADEVSTTYNQVAVTGVDRSGVVSVEAPSAVRWSMTIGRGAPAQQESPGIG